MMGQSGGPTRSRPFTVIAVIVVLVSFSGCLDDPDDGNEEEKITINLGVPSVSPRHTGTEMLHDAEWDVNKVTPKDTKAKWSDFSAVIKAANGSVLLPSTPLTEDTGTYGSNVEVWFSDSTGGRDTMDAGDAIVVTGMDATSYEGATIQVIHKGNLAGSSVLPTDFP